jgi:uroporphyrinogen III methyltransferase / synthase
MTEKPLANRTVVITRAEHQAREFASELENLGARVIICPTIEITDPETYERLDEAINHLYGYDWIIFTSVNGVEYFFRRLTERRHSIEELDSARVCAVGDSTAERLRELQVHVDVIPTVFKAEGVFSALEEFVGGADNLTGLNFLMPRAAVARDTLPSALTNAGARVDVVAAYRTLLPTQTDRARLAAMLAGGADCIAFSSSSQVKNLAKLFDTQDLSETLAGVTIACIGDVTSQTANDFGLVSQIVPSQSTISSFVTAISEYFASNPNR